MITLNADVRLAFNLSNQTGIVPNVLAALDRVIDQLENEYVGHKAIPIGIVVFADSIGNATINQHLSLVRAQTICKYLVAQGLGNGVMTQDGRGSSHPVVTDCPNKATQPSIACHAPNRRVVISIYLR